MPDHNVGTREEWRAARLQLLEAEKALTRRSDELAQMRQQLPWVRIDKEYRFDTEEGPATLADLFRGRSQLLVYHFMFGPEYQTGCPACSAIADGFNGFVAHLANHDITLYAVSRAPLATLQAYKQRMGWSFPWASSHDSDFNFDFQAAITEEQQQSGAVEYNFRTVDMRPDPNAEDGPDASPVGTDWATYSRQMPGMSAFALDGGAVTPRYAEDEMSAHEIDAYLERLEEPKRSTLQQLRETILEIIPDAEQCISYTLPAFRVQGKVVAGFAAFKHHLSYLPHSGSVLPELGDAAAGYGGTKGSLHFPVDRPLPKPLVEKLITIRLRQIGEA